MKAKKTKQPKEIDFILSKLKAHFKVTKDADLLEKLNIPRGTMDTWKNRDSIPMARLKEISKKTGMPLSLLLDKGATILESSQPLHVNNYDIPLLSAVASAGSGIENFDISIIGSFPVPNIYFKTPPNLKHLKALKVIGDSMTPTLNNDDIVVIEECMEFKNDGVYVINLCGELRVKRLIRRIDGIEVKSDNPTYGSEFIKNDGLKGFLIIGKVRLEIKRC